MGWITGLVGGVSRIRFLRAPEPLLGRLADAVKRRSAQRLRAVLACTFTFNAEWFETVLDHVFADTPRAGIPIDVVCDERHYRGHGRGYNVRRWPREKGLFHPKLLIVLFNEEVVWAEGSLNMTREGWQRNRELATLHEPGHSRLPRAVRRLLSEIERAAPTSKGGNAVSEILRRTRFEFAKGSLTSVGGESIGQRFLHGLGSEATRELHVVTPFLDQGEADDPLDAWALDRIVSRTRPDKIHLYLPAMDESGSRVQGSASLREVLAGQIVVVHPVPSDPGALHAKCLVVRYGWGGARARVLCGSPNVTRNALFRTRGANVELGRRIPARWRDVEPLLRAIRPLKARRLHEVRFQPPPREIQDPGWDAVDRASYLPLENAIELTWRRPNLRSATRVSHAGSILTDLGDTPDRRSFGGTDRFDHERAWVDVAHRRDEQRCSRVPVEVPLEEVADLGEGLRRTPQEWLDGLGTVAGLSLPLASSDSGGAEGTGSDASSTTFDWGRRVRDLAARARSARAGLVQDGLPPRLIQSRWSYMEKVWQAHDPARCQDELEKAWRTWVRLVIAGSMRGVSGNARYRSKKKAALDFLSRTVKTAPLPIREDVRDMVAVIEATRGREV